MVQLKKTAQAVILVCFGPVCALLLIEGGFRLWQYAAVFQGTADDRPIFYYRPAGPGRDFRNYPYDPRKPAGVFRIAAVGDSFTAPDTLQLDDVYAKRLERMLNSNYPVRTDRRAEVINYGVPGFSTAQETGSVRKALAEGADFVLLQITLNDPAADNTPAAQEERLKGALGAQRLEITPESHPLYWHLRSLGFIAARLQNSRVRRYHDAYYRHLWEDHDTWRSFTVAVREMKRLTAQAGAGFGAFIFPLFHKTIDEHYEFEPIHRKIRGYLDHIGVPNLDLTPAYFRIRHERLEAIPGRDAHPDELAHRIAAEYVYLWLEKIGAVPAEFRIRPKYQRRGDKPARLKKNAVIGNPGVWRQVEESAQVRVQSTIAPAK